MDKFIKTEDGILDVTGAGREETRRWWFVGTEFQFGEIKRSGVGQSAWLHNNTLCHWVLHVKMVKVLHVKEVNLMLCVFYHNKNRVIHAHGEHSLFKKVIVSLLVLPPPLLATVPVSRSSVTSGRCPWILPDISYGHACPLLYFLSTQIESCCLLFCIVVFSFANITAIFPVPHRHTHLILPRWGCMEGTPWLNLFSDDAHLGRFHIFVL